jgi:uncharacterized protein
VSRICFALVLCALSTSVGAAQTPTPTPVPPASEGPVVVTSGEGVVTRAPDRAWVMVAAQSRAKTPKEAQKLNADVMAAVLQKLKSAGLDAEAIQTRGYDLQPEYDYANGRQTLRAYVARNNVEIRVDDLPRVGEFIDLAVSSGATNVGGVRFDVKNRAGLERDALRIAVEDARGRADAAAAGARMKVERIVRIEEHRADAMPPPRPVMMAMRAEAGQAAAEPPIEAGQIEIRSVVTLTAAIR